MDADGRRRVTRNDMVTVVGPANDGLGGGNNRCQMVTLAPTVEVPTFIVYAPTLDAADGDMADSASSSAPVDCMDMVTITGVAAGMATITVTAMDAGSGMSASQTIMVTVAERQQVLMAPTNVGTISLFAGQVGVAWQPGENAFGHLVVLFDSANNVADSMTLGPSADSHTFNGVAAGDYSVVVVSFRSGSDYKLASGVPVTVR